MSEEWAEARRPGGVGVLGVGITGDSLPGIGGFVGESGQRPTQPGVLWSLSRVNASQQERYVELLKERCNVVEGYYPTYKRTCRPHGRRTTIEVVRPVYPGYVFVGIREGEEARAYREVASLPVRVGWVRFGGIIEAVPDRVVERLKSLERAGQLVKEVRYVDPYVRGVRVKVCLPMQDILGVIIRRGRGNRLLVETGLGRAWAPVHTVKVV